MLRLAIERRRRGISLLRLYEMTRIDPGNLSRIERGQVPAYPGWRRRIAEALEIADEDWLFEEVDESERSVGVPRTGKGGTGCN